MEIEVEITIEQIVRVLRQLNECGQVRVMDGVLFDIWMDMNNRVVLDFVREYESSDFES